MKSSHVDGIKISRLNDLAQKEDASNPLARYNKIQQERDRRRASVQPPSGGVKTAYLEQFNAEAKFQVDAIQDFACKDSLYKKNEGVLTNVNAASRIPLKSLIGR